MFQNQNIKHRDSYFCNMYVRDFYLPPPMIQPDRALEAAVPATVRIAHAGYRILYDTLLLYDV